MEPFSTGPFQAFDTYFHALDGVPIPEALAPVARVREALYDTDLRVVIFGAIKTGKSSLFNALTGSTIAPVEARKGRGPVLIARHGFEATVTSPSADGSVATEPLGFHSVPAGDVVEVSLPLSFLGETGVLIDTPGLLDDREEAERALWEMERADLAVMVLAADKILSAEERDLAAREADLLNGNVVFVINRLDTIEVHDQEGIHAWTERALRHTGNDLVGRARIFATSLPPDGKDTWRTVSELRDWLGALLLGPDRLSVIRRARLGRLLNALGESAEAVARERDAAAQRCQEARTDYWGRVMRERIIARGAIAAARERVRVLDADLAAMGDAFVAACIAASRGDIGTGNGSLRIVYQDALRRYAEDLDGRLSLALTGSPVHADPFARHGWVLQPQVDIEVDPARKVANTMGDFLTRPLDGGKTGRQVGSALGGWVGKHVISVDSERILERRITGAVRNLLETVEVEARFHIEQVLQDVDREEAAVDEWAPPSRQVEAAEDQERYWAAMLQWSEGFSRAVMRELEHEQSGSSST